MDELSDITQPPRGVCLTQGQIAELFGVSRMRVYQVEMSALRRLRLHHPELAEYLGLCSDEEPT